MSLLSRLAVQAARAYGILSSDKNRVSADYLVVAGGGGGAGGTAGGGGGGAGGLLTSTATLSTLNTYSIAVGAGGNGGAVNTIGSQGNNSSISGTGLSTITSTGGGYGGYNNVAAGSGGSGGGGGGRSTTNRFGGAGTSGQGYAGGDGLNDSTNQSGAGGGGAGAVGGAASGSSTGGAGGNGVASSISGSSVTYAGGGGGAGYYNTSYGTTSNGGLGGSGGGGTANSAGTANLGGGGGGGGGSAGGGGAGAGAAGGSGIVIISYTSATPKFVGGTITTSGGKQIHTFTSSGTLSPITPITASYLVVAGGGAGGGVATTNYYGGGGGGAGGLLSGSTTLYSGASYVVTVGAGAAGSATNTRASNGSDSSLSGTGLTTITSTGGGSGGTQSTNTGASGGSGGGGQNSSAGGSGTSGQGYAGGTAVSGGAGGGGGSSAVGSNGTSSNSGAGGNGTASSITGSSVTYAGGGGGGGYKGAPAINGGSGGTGGGGTGAPSTGGAGGSGTPNSGSGGGGACWFSADVAGGSGGSGIVIISYAGSQAFNGGLVTSSGGNTIHTFTSTGALTPLTNNLNNSLRFRSSASANLQRTPTSATNRKTWTWSAWVKRGTIGSITQGLFMGNYDGNDNSTYFGFSGDQFFFFNRLLTVANGNIYTTAVYRDPSAWYHIVVAMDTTQATAANRFKLYVNGNQVTSFAIETYPTQNTDMYINSNVQHNIGFRRDGSTNNYFDGYLADVNFIDGQQLEPYYFGNNDANGVWKPIQYKGTYGTNGFYLTFGNTTSTTTLGYDSSPNGNNWTCNNISLTAGTTYDAMLDVPTNTSATVANYCVLNPLNYGGTAPIDGNLKDVMAATTGKVKGTMAMPSGKFYAEFTLLAYSANLATAFGVQRATDTSDVTTQGVSYYSNGNKIIDGSGTAYGASFTTNDVIGVAIDVSVGTITFYKNNVSQGAITLPSGTDWMFASSNGTSTGTQTIVVNFGQQPFTYTPPTGYVALNTYNLPTPTILQGNKYMDATLYTGNGSTQVIVNQAQFKPDFVWVKARSVVRSHKLTDSVRGATKSLATNNTDAEDTNTTGLTAFNSNGFTLGADTNYNDNTVTFVGWQWQAGQGTTSSNTSGSITSTVSVNTTAGFSVATWTAPSSGNWTIGHGLGVAPSFIITKSKSAGGWIIYHSALGNTKWLEFTTAAAQTGTSFPFNSVSPTSTLITYGNATSWGASANFVTYSWAEITGFSKFGSYTGNSSTDGPFIYTGFRPKFVLFKISSGSTGNWFILDTSRSTYNESVNLLNPDTSDAAADVSPFIDILSNGIKIRRNSVGLNNSGYTYIYAAFAEHPFKISNAR